MVITAGGAMQCGDQILGNGERGGNGKLEHAGPRGETVTDGAPENPRRHLFNGPVELGSPLTRTSRVL